MPIYEFTSPDGKTYEVEGPEGSTKEQAFAKLQQQLAQSEDRGYAGSQFNAAEEAQSRAQMTHAKPAGRAPSGFVRGFIEDPSAGLQQLAAETELAGLIAPEWKRRKQAELQAAEAKYQSGRESAGETGVDWSRLAGQIVNPVNIGLSALTKTPPGASMALRAGTGAAGGAMMGAVGPAYGDATRSQNMLAGMLGGAISAPVAGAVGRMVSPKVDPNIALLRKEGITPTVGQQIGPRTASVEDRAMSIPGLGDVIKGARNKSLDQLNLAVYNRALSPVGIKPSGKLGAAGVAEVRTTLSNMYNDTLKGVQVVPDAPFTQEFTQLNSQVANMLEPEQRIWKGLMEKLNYRTAQGTIDDKMLKRIHTSIDETANKLRADGSFEKGELADVLDDLRTSINETVKRQHPNKQAALSKLDEAWANYSILRDAAYRAEKRAGSGMFTPADLEAAVVNAAQRGRTKQAAKGVITEGQGLMQDLSTAALRTLPSTYADSGTAGRALFAAGTLGGATNPATLPYALTAGAASLPYLPGVRNALSYAISGRQGPTANALANVIRGNPALLSPAVSPLLVDMLNKQ